MGQLLTFDRERVDAVHQLGDIFVAPSCADSEVVTQISCILARSSKLDRRRPRTQLARGPAHPLN